MPRRRTRIPLSVFLNGRLVGTLRREASGAIEFQYDEDWLGWEHAFPVSLSLPLREDRYIGAPVIAVFDNLLPDNDDIRRRLAARTHADGPDVYSLLAAIGRECVGALQFLPEGADPGPVGRIEAAPISAEQIGARLANLEAAPLGIDEEEDFRISIAGTQEKTALLYWNDAWHVPQDSTPTTHILKPQIGNRDGRDLTRSVENEHLCMRLLATLDLPVARTEIRDFAGQRALVVERFDRRRARDGRLLRVPQEDCCQALSVPPSRKYESAGGPGIPALLEFLKGSDDPAREQLVFLKAQIAFWLLAATDGHAKNFSVFLFPGGGFRLTPLYDVMSTQHLYDIGQLRRAQMKIAMAVGNSRHYRIDEIAARHFEQSADTAGMPPGAVEAILTQLADTMPAAIDTVCACLPADFPEPIRDSIIGGIHQRLSHLNGAAQ
jgi:serine/threonine-protein kinase HipA